MPPPSQGQRPPPIRTDAAQEDVAQPAATVRALVALGSNLSVGADGPARLVAQALARLAGPGDRLVAASALHATPCFPAGAGPDYVNAAAVLETRRGARALMTHLHGLEAAFGRDRAQHWGSRTLDLDLIAHGRTVLPDAATQTEWRALPAAAQIGRSPDRLILPHPRMQDRGFVLVPLAEVAPDWVHPLTGASVAEMLAALPAVERAAIRRLPVAP